jgi:hypothetical protein
MSGAVGDGEGLDAVDPAGAEADRIAGLGDVRHGVGDRVEDELDLQLGQAGAQAVVRAQAAVAEVRVGVATDVEPPRFVEDFLVEVSDEVPVLRAPCQMWKTARRDVAVAALPSSGSPSISSVARSNP